jgi:hypothetical protein
MGVGLARCDTARRSADLIADFWEMTLERLEEAHKPGVRQANLCITRQTISGGFQADLVTHNGLTGADVIRALHRLGFVCDAAHATEDDRRRGPRGRLARPGC